MATIIGNMKVTANAQQGGRESMEDVFSVQYKYRVNPNDEQDQSDLLYVFFGVFDGHGGPQAADYTKKHLMDQIAAQDNFWVDDDQLILKAIHDGFVNTHQAMWKELGQWPRSAWGYESTSGTTASIAIVKGGKIYTGHVGDSRIVLGYQDPEQRDGIWTAKSLTEDHKPNSPQELSRISRAGGQVMAFHARDARVAWIRPRGGHKGPIRRSTKFDTIPFLAMSRALGNFWSYNWTQNQFVVSPSPDVSVMEIDVDTHRCLILASDGVWNMLSPQDALDTVCFVENNNNGVLTEGSTEVTNTWIDPSIHLVSRALAQWQRRSHVADNTSAITVILEYLRPPQDTVTSTSGIPVPREHREPHVVKLSAPRESQKKDKDSEVENTSATSGGTAAATVATTGSAKSIRCSDRLRLKRGFPSTNPVKALPKRIKRH